MKYKQNYFTPMYPEKYVGDVKNIFYRSGWEMQFMKWADASPGVLHWNNEELVVPYISPKDNKWHRYFVDFVIKVQTRDGNVKTYAVEIKPHAQTLPPKQVKAKTAKTQMRLIESTITYAVNQAKWNAASAFCNARGIEFLVITEKHMNI